MVVVRLRRARASIRLAITGCSSPRFMVSLAVARQFRPTRSILCLCRAMLGQLTITLCPSGRPMAIILWNNPIRVGMKTAYGDSFL